MVVTSVRRDLLGENRKSWWASERSFRIRRFRQFLDQLKISVGDSILDVGGLPQTWEGTGLESNVTIVNLQVDVQRKPALRWVIGDACNLNMFRDNEFDVVFSNSVIEHVGDMDRQRCMASEIQRVARRYWVQTPHKHFPLEIHFLFPCFQYFPRNARVRIANVWPLSHAKMLGLDPIYELDHIWLLTRNQFSSLFPQARILTERVLGMPKSLIAIKT